MLSIKCNQHLQLQTFFCVAILLLSHSTFRAAQYWSNWELGSAWIDFTERLSASDGSHIIRVCVCDRDYIDEIEIGFDNTDYSHIGRWTDSQTCDYVDFDECYTSMNVRFGAQMDSLQMVTSNNRKSTWWGYEPDNPVSISGDYYKDCISKLEFKIRSETYGDLIIGIRAYFVSIPSIQTPTPTSSPTPSPTPAPTTISTMPTNAPSLSPTNIPSTSPSQQPTVSPTAIPTTQTVSPTQTPNVAPSVPTDFPSITPTRKPTVAPTLITHAPNAIETFVSVPDNDGTVIVEADNDGAVIVEADNIIYTVCIVIGGCFVCLCIIGALIYCQRSTQPRASKVDSISMDRMDDSNGKVWINAEQGIYRSEIVEIEDDGDDNDVDILADVHAENKNELKAWLNDTVELPQYYNNFIDNGYEGISFVKAITDKAELKATGINVLGHQTRIMGEIRILNKNEPIINDEDAMGSQSESESRRVSEKVDQNDVESILDGNTNAEGNVDIDAIDDGFITLS